MRDLPQRLTDQVKVLLLDFIRATVLGSSTDWAGAVRQLVRRLGSQGKSTIFMSGEKTDPPRAALVNGTSAGCLEWDDTHVGAMLHPGAVVFPPILALGEEVGATGPQLIAAVIAGYETMIRIGLSIQPSHFHRGFQSTATCGVFGSAVASAKILGMTGEKIAETLGIAGSYASGLAQFFKSGSSVKRIHAGKSSEAGCMAALLSQAGITGPKDILEGEHGFCRAFSDGFDSDRIMGGLGRDYKILEVTLKPHATSARIQASIEGALHLCKGYSIRFEHIKRVSVAIPQVIAGRLTHPDPPDLQAAQMSLPFTLALALWLGTTEPEKSVLTITDYERNLNNPKIRDLSRQILCQVTPEVDSATTDEYVPSRVEIQTNEGENYSHFVPIPKGSPGNPLSLAEASQRFKSSLGLFLPEIAVEEIVARVTQLEELKDLPSLTHLIS